MKKIYFEDFRASIQIHYREIQASEPEYQSTEWFLLRYLKNIDKNAVAPADPDKVEGSMRGFIRFYVDMIEEKSVLGERCRRIYSEYRKTIRDNQES